MEDYAAFSSQVNGVPMEGTDPVRTSSAGQTREVVATYSSYPDAERAVDKLSDSDFPAGFANIGFGEGSDVGG